MGYKHSKEDIIEKGSRIIQSRGYTNTGISDILKEAGIPKGSFYNFFENKESFCSDVIDFYGEIGYQAMLSVFSDSGKTALEKLESYYYDFMLQRNRSSNTKMGCLINNLSYELGHQNKTLAKKLNSHYKKQIKAISRVIKKAQEDNDIRNDYSETELAEFLHSNTIGGMGRMKTTGSIAPLKRSIDLSFAFLKEK